MEEDQVNICLTSNRVQRSSSRRWPIFFWVTLKILSVFYHETLVTERKCYVCKMKEMNERKRRRLNLQHVMEDDGDLNCLLLVYECDSKRITSDDGGNIQENNNRQLCEVCETLWWNFEGETERYTETDIGANRWNHKGSGILSCFFLLLTMAALILFASFYFNEMWAKPEEILHLINRSTNFLVLISPALIGLCSKLRSRLRGAAPILSWASVMNARFIIKRAQFLDLSRKGMPGKAFIFICMAWPLLNAVYRIYIVLYLSDCNIRIAVVTTIVALLFTEIWTFFMYLLYFIRMSFQRHMNLLLSFIQEHEGQVDKCRGVLACLAVDFSCYSQLCGLYALIMIPLGILALTTNITWDYMLTSLSCETEDSMNIQQHFKYMSWSIVGMGWVLLVSAMGGLQVTSMWDDLSVHILQLQSDQHHHFWKALLWDASFLGKGISNLLPTVICSLIGIFLG